ncbi:GNAT family N-acetyltransferase [Saccharothrix sp. ST-888]|uniref:GNAT family N-acetyltransferase n=1 Tax=Saccharothrix sp. ST-888 TaxID=1427391 RepID=UPI0005ECB897|nr:GNAT family N-acetyltransferase [Saccharothrix sp. ST-888]
MTVIDNDPMTRLFVGPRGGRISTAALRDASHWDEAVVDLGYEHRVRTVAEALRAARIPAFDTPGAVQPFTQQVLSHGRGLFGFGLITITWEPTACAGRPPAAQPLTALGRRPALEVKERNVVMSLETAPFAAEHASSDELRAWYELAVTSTAADYPSSPVPPYDSYVQQLRQSTSYLGLQRLWVARDSGRLIGTASAVFPTDENSERAIISVRVSAQYRRRGVGTRLLQTMLPEIHERGCRRIAGQTKASADGEKWTNALGFRAVAQRASHHLDIKSVDPARWQVPPTPGFRIQKWVDTAPDDLVQSFARARNAIADSPTGETSYRHPDWTAERVRQYETRMREIGETHRYVVAVDERSGAVAGFTEIAIIPRQSSFCHQEDTAVLPEFRGLGLGRAVKAAMMRWLTADLPHLEQVHTMTASDNLHMIRVNAPLGYVTDHVVSSVESEVGALEARLAGLRPRS